VLAACRGGKRGKTKKVPLPPANKGGRGLARPKFSEGGAVLFRKDAFQYTTTKRSRAGKIKRSHLHHGEKGKALFHHKKGGLLDGKRLERKRERKSRLLLPLS